MIVSDTQAKKILEIIKAAGEKGITRRDISRALRGRVCDCENWMNTFLEAGIIEKCGKQGKADLFRFAD